MKDERKRTWQSMQWPNRRRNVLPRRRRASQMFRITFLSYSRNLHVNHQGNHRDNHHTDHRRSRLRDQKVWSLHSVKRDPQSRLTHCHSRSLWKEYLAVLKLTLHQFCIKWSNSSNYNRNWKSRLKFKTRREKVFSPPHLTIKSLSHYTRKWNRRLNRHFHLNLALNQ